MTTNSQGCEGHIHHGSMSLYAEDATKTEEPLTLWEKRIPGISPDWEPCTVHPAWSHAAEYRRKAKRITLGAHSFPEPVREALEYGEEFYLVSILAHQDIMKMEWSRSNVKEQMRWLALGLIQATEQGAIDQLATIKALCNGEGEL